VEEDMWHSDNLQDDTEELSDIIFIISVDIAFNRGGARAKAEHIPLYGGSRKSVGLINGGTITIYFIFCVSSDYNAHVIFILRQGVLI
jgi:hypothetical protein